MGGSFRRGIRIKIEREENPRAHRQAVGGPGETARLPSRLRAAEGGRYKSAPRSAGLFKNSEESRRADLAMSAADFRMEVP